jgi:hypothetical protein
MPSIMTIHGFRGNEEPCGKPQGIINHITTLLPKVTLWQATGNSQVKGNNLKNSTLNMLKIQPYFDAIDRKR